MMLGGALKTSTRKTKQLLIDIYLFSICHQYLKKMFLDPRPIFWDFLILQKLWNTELTLIVQTISFGHRPKH